MTTHAPPAARRAAPRTAALKAVLAERILVLDGATGTRIQTEELQEADFRGERFKDHTDELLNLNDLLVLTQPELILGIHGEYLAAGADVIETNTFNANSISLADYGLSELVYEVNLEAAKLARRAVSDFEATHPGETRFVAGSIGPTSRMLSMSQDVNDPAARNTSFEELRGTYYDQVRGLVEGGVDLLLPETNIDTLNLKACLFAIDQVLSERGIAIPTIASVTFIQEGSDRTLSGQTLQAFLASIDHADLLGVTINCALGPIHMRAQVQELSERCSLVTGCYPNAGLPNEFGGFDMDPESMAKVLGEFAEAGWLNIVGGCCGTMPIHIKAIADAVRGLAKRELPELEERTTFSGLDAYEFREDANLTMVGERTNVAGSRKFLRLIRQEKFEEAVEIARKQVEGGANLIDVCMDEALLDAQACMTTFLNQIASEPDVARVPVMVDSSDFAVLEAGLKCVQGKGVANSLSLKDGEELFLERARIVHRYGAAVVIMAFDEVGQATGVERRVEIASRAYRLLTEDAGFAPRDIIFDLNVYPVATGLEADERNSLDFIEAIAAVKALFPAVRFSGGVSNVSFSYRGNDVVREAMHAVFLYHAIKAGLDMAIVNAGQLTVLDEVDADLREAVEDVILARKPGATDRLTELAERYIGQKTVREEDTAWREQPLPERIKHALLHGVVAFVEEDMAEALATYPTPLSVIEGPLMDGMSVVGELFGSGKMFLPQVVKSARVMQKAVAQLTPHMEREAGQSRGKVLLATVKGDVHDIGKNIVGVVLGCNGFEIVDLGVMVSCDKILKTAIEISADYIGLSGLITPSLHEMVHVAKEMKRQEFQIPLLIGGATTSRKHTAVKIAPEYDQTLHVLDATCAVNVLSTLTDDEGRAKLLAETLTDQEAARVAFANRAEKKPLLAWADAKANRLALSFEDLPQPTLGVQVLTPNLAEVCEYIDWTPFFTTWQLRGTYPKILERPGVGEKAKELKADADAMLARIQSEGWFQPQAIYGLFPAASEGEDLVVLDESRSEVRVRLPMLRQQGQLKRGPNLSLVDFVAPRESEAQDHIGAFVVTAGKGVGEAAARFRAADHDEYQAIMVQALGDRIAEALAEWLHERVRAEWGYEALGTHSKEDLIRERYRGIRPAPGYPASPDHLLKPRLFSLLGEDPIGVTLTESMAMLPASSVSGFYFAHPKARYFGVGRIGGDQVADYAQRAGIEIETAERWLAPNLDA